MTAACGQEMCPHWAGDGRVCVCVALDIEPPEFPYRRRSLPCDTDHHDRCLASCGCTCHNIKETP